MPTSLAGTGSFVNKLPRWITAGPPAVAPGVPNPIRRLAGAVPFDKAAHGGLKILVSPHVVISELARGPDAEPEPEEQRYELDDAAVWQLPFQEDVGQSI